MMLEKIATLLKTGVPENIELAYQLSQSSQTSLWPLERAIKDLLYLAHTQPKIPVDNLHLGELCFVLKEVIALTINPTHLMHIPEQLYFLPNLRILEINAPSITQLPKSLGELARLKSLSIRNTNIEGLPTTIDRLQQLTSLTLVNNPKLLTIPSVVNDLPNLKTIRISSNLAAQFKLKQAELILE